MPHFARVRFIVTTDTINTTHGELVAGIHDWHRDDRCRLDTKLIPFSPLDKNESRMGGVETRV